jgi:ATP-dependent RNA helicase DDX49/DBP8
MAAEKVKVDARSVPIEQVSEEASDSTSPSDSESAQSSAHSSHSDSLDSRGSRKRRKTSPTQRDEDDDDDEPLISAIPTLSRVKSNPQKGPLVINNHTNNGTILAPIDPQTSFSSLNVKPWLVGSLGAMAIKRPTGIQKGCIPEILKGRDCIGGSRTGSGKTVAFAVPILQKWAEDPFGIFALVLTPTRYGSLLQRR